MIRPDAFFTTRSSPGVIFSWGGYLLQVGGDRGLLIDLLEFGYEVAWDKGWVWVAKRS